VTATLEPVLLTPEAEPSGAVGLGPCRALEHRFDLLVPPHGGFVEALGHLVAPFRTRPEEAVGGSRYTVDFDPATGHHVLACDGERVASGRKARDLVPPLAWHLNRAVIDRSASRLHLMHASAVTRAGQTVVLPADMESGKTTTAAGLLREGYGYVTDEAVAVDTATGLVHPFPKRLSVDPGSWPLFPDLASKYDVRGARQWQVDPTDLGATAATRPVAAPAVIVFPRYVPGATTEVVPIGRSEAAYELARMTFYFAQAPGRNLRSAARLVERSTVARLRIGDLEEAVAAIDALVSERLLGAL
jgi:hypothetical protein